MFDSEELDVYLGKTPEKSQRTAIGYCRVSTT